MWFVVRAPPQSKILATPMLATRLRLLGAIKRNDNNFETLNDASFKQQY